MASNSKRPVAPLFAEPSAYTADSLFIAPGGDAELRCTYEREGAMYSGGFRFVRVRAFRYRAEGHCTAWHVDGAYDTLVEVESSAWIDEIRRDSPLGGHEWKMHHYLIYVDDAGAYEVISESIERIPEVAAPAG